MLSSFAVIAFAGLIHASFQLSISMLTLLSGHAIGRKASHAKVLRLSSAFSSGVAVMTVLMLSFIALLLQHSLPGEIPLLVWASACGLLVGVGVAIWAFYYRPQTGTSLWMPRSMARYISQRTKATKNSGEAFGLGLSSVASELLFIIGPLLVTGLVLITLEPVWQLVGIATYSFFSLLSLLIVNGLIGSGHRISRIQKWREANKRFLQFAAGAGLIVLGVYLYIDKVMALSVLAPGGF